MDRAIALGREHGIGCVALGNTNHWMRARNLRLAGGRGRASSASAGPTPCPICRHGAEPSAVIGNNPLVIAVPRAGGPVVLDMAMSQFSYGQLESYRKRGEMLPVDGGFDSEGNLTRDPGAIEKSWRPLPIGYWKGSGLSVVLDMIAAMMALGQATHQIAHDPLLEAGISQMFVAMNPAAFGPQPQAAADRRRRCRLAAQLPARCAKARSAIPASKRCASARKTCASVCPSSRRLGRDSSVPAVTVTPGKCYNEPQERRVRS